MKQQIHINDQGELLLIEAPEKPLEAGEGDINLTMYSQALTSAIEKGIKFREQRWIITLINRELNRLASDDLPKGQSFDLLTGYTVEVEHQCRVDETHEFERCAFGDCNRKGEGNKRKVAVLIPLKHSKKLPTLKDYNHQRYAHYDKPLDNNAGVACEKCGKEMQYVDQNLVTLGNPPSTKVTCECGNSGYKVL